MSRSQIRLLIIGLIAGGLLLQAAPVTAQLVPSRIRELAMRSVVAIDGPSGIRTGFVFGDHEAVIASGETGNGNRLVTAGGVSFRAQLVSDFGKIAVLGRPHLALPALPASASPSSAPGAAAYVLGPPLGYEANRLRRVRLPALKLHSTRAQAVTGTLPASFQGAPVLSSHGRVLGAVYTIAAHEWMLEPTKRLLAMLPAHNTSGGGFPLLLVLVGIAIAIAVAVAGVMLRVRRRRERASEAASAVQPPASSPVAGEMPRGPLVRRREAVAEVDQAEDFEVVIKGREDS
jgi:hypothetical protein